jgi:magnesium-transporting ATPase (P-type)
MLLVFEATVVKSRQRNLGTLRAMAQRPPRNVLVFRGRQWQRISASGLVPGDLISVARDVASEAQQAGIVCLFVCLL